MERRSFDEYYNNIKKNLFLFKVDDKKEAFRFFSEQYYKVRKKSLKLWSY